MQTMNILDRILLVIYSLSVGAASVLMIGIGFNWFDREIPVAILSSVYNEYEYGIPWIVGFLALFLLSIRFIFWRDGRGRSAHSIDQRTDFGDIRISIETIENLALKASNRFRGIRDVKTKVRVDEKGLTIALKMNVEGDQSIPELSEEIQRSVKSYIEDITGIPVATLTVYISNVVSPGLTRHRVE
jgi:uncharacterized alkaline shock family protein YloU